jgi:hypothetical protein
MIPCGTGTLACASPAARGSPGTPKSHPSKKSWAPGAPACERRIMWHSVSCGLLLFYRIRKLLRRRRRMRAPAGRHTEIFRKKFSLATHPVTSQNLQSPLSPHRLVLHSEDRACISIASPLPLRPVLAMHLRLLLSRFPRLRSCRPKTTQSHRLASVGPRDIPASHSGSAVLPSLPGLHATLLEAEPSSATRKKFCLHTLPTDKPGRPQYCRRFSCPERYTYPKHMQSSFFLRVSSSSR